MKASTARIVGALILVVFVVVLIFAPNLTRSYSTGEIDRVQSIYCITKGDLLRVLKLYQAPVFTAEMKEELQDLFELSGKKFRNGQMWDLAACVRYTYDIIVLEGDPKDRVVSVSVGQRRKTMYPIKVLLYKAPDKAHVYMASPYPVKAK